MMIDHIASYFGFRENNTDVKTEVLAGATTFMTMSYIIFVQPAILGTAGMDKGAVMVATCIASALAMILMGLLTNYPIALAPGMGHNVFFAVVVCGIMGFIWQVALGAVFISGSIFLLLTFFHAWDKEVYDLNVKLKKIHLKQKKEQVIFRKKEGFTFRVHK